MSKFLIFLCLLLFGTKCLAQNDIFFEKEDITFKIKDNVFIGMNAIILPGTKIGSNVIIGAGSVVNGELNSNSVYAGVPAKFICSLDDFVDKHKDKFINSKHLNQKDKKEFLKSFYKEISCHH